MMLTHEPVMYAGGGFPWGLLIIGGILYFLWHKGVIGGPGRGNWQRHNGGNGGYYPAQMPGPGGPPPAGGQQPQPGQFGGQYPQDQGQAQFSGPRAWFDEWHRQAHEAENAPAHGHQAQPFTPPAPAAPAAPSAPAAPTQSEQPPRNDQGANI